METIVKIDVKGLILTCVVFGGVDFKMGEEVKFGFRSDFNVLFDKRSGLNIASGRLM